MRFILTRVALVTVLALLAIFNSAMGQVKPAKPMENVGKQSQKYTLGLRIGPSIIWGHYPKNLPDTILETHKNKQKVGFTAVGVIGFPMKDDYSCIIEAGYSRGGRKVQYNRGDWVNDFTYNFISTSLALRKAWQFRFREGIYADWYVNVGPNISYLMNGKGVILTSNGGKTPFTLEFSNQTDSAWIKARNKESAVDKYYMNNPNRFFFGLEVGVGTYFPITNKQRLHVEVRGNLGGTFIKKRNTLAYMGGQNGGFIGGTNSNPNPNPDQGTFSDPLTTNMRSITFTASYTFNFDQKEKKKGKSTLDKKRKSSSKKRR